MRRSLRSLAFLLALVAALVVPVSAQDGPTAEPSLSPLPTAVPLGDGPLVQAVLFFSPTCGHCHAVITQTLPPLFDEHGGQPSITVDPEVAPEEVAFYLMSNGRLQLLLVDVSMPDGKAMFTADGVRLDTDSGGVPRLDVADGYLIGSGDIPAEFPGIVARGFEGEGEGVGWPPVPGLEVALAPFVADGSVPGPSTDGPAPAATDAPVDEAPVVIPIGDGANGGWLDKLDDDPAGNAVAVVVLVLLIISIVGAPVLAARGSLPRLPGWLVLVLAVVGIGVAAYLASVETSGSEAVCGPVGDCNTVQSSEYAQFFGIPIGVLGIVGYALIGGLWLISRVARGTVADVALVLIGLGAFSGTLFSVYLTFLEPFVIGATCMWCITSALVMMALLWVTAGPAWSAWQRLRGGSGPTAAATASP